MTVLIAVVALLVALSGFFSGSEIAFFSVPDTRAEALAEEGRRGSRALVRLKATPDRLLITLLIGNNVVNIGAASIATYAATQAFGSAGVGIATGGMTLLVLFFGEIVPKSFAAANAEKRSEEHTSELQSQNAISYAVFCLRSEERRVGKECRMPCRSRWSPYH